MGKFDLLSTCLVDAHFVEHESTKDTKKDKYNEARGCENDHHGGTITTLNNRNILIANLNNSIFVDRCNDLVLVHSLVLVNVIVLIDLHDWDVGNKLTFLLFLGLGAVREDDGLIARCRYNTARND